MLVVSRNPLSTTCCPPLKLKKDLEHRKATRFHESRAFCSWFCLEIYGAILVVGSEVSLMSRA